MSNPYQVRLAVRALSAALGRYELPRTRRPEPRPDAAAEGTEAARHDPGGGVPGERPVPDAVFSAHAHHYQRITYTLADGREIPHLIVGSGGHSPIENLACPCEGDPWPAPSTPCDVVLPPGLTLPDGASVQMVAYNHLDFGFLRLTLDAEGRNLTGDFFAAFSEARDSARLPELCDSFSLDLEKHRVK